jgi:hypothetical protein
VQVITFVFEDNMPYQGNRKGKAARQSREMEGFMPLVLLHVLDRRHSSTTVHMLR